jgi:uncharacterized protein
MQASVDTQKTIATTLKDMVSKHIWYAIPVILLFVCLVILYLTGKLAFSWKAIEGGINQDFFLYLVVGIMAQLVDGTLGMGYGATSTSLLLSLGISPAVSSTSVHISEMFTTGASAISHHRFGNINKKLFRYLLLPGILGAVTGAYLLADRIDGDAIKPYIAGYMIVLGIIIIRKGIQKNIVKKKTKQLGFLAAFGGFMDAVGGGGWGPIVTSTLLGRGRDPRYTIGSVNAAEFAVAFSSGVTFMIFQGINSWQVASGLILGGVIAAPFGAFLLNKVPRKPMMVLVGCLVIVLSIRTLVKFF